jgi:orotidine-5'-phosphate decarboxylase
MQADPKVIVALDFADPTRAIAFVDRLDPTACATVFGIS